MLDSSPFKSKQRPKCCTSEEWNSCEEWQTNLSCLIFLHSKNSGNYMSVAETAAQKFHPRPTRILLFFPFHYVLLLSTIASWLQDAYHTSRHCIQISGRKEKRRVFLPGKQRLYWNLWQTSPWASWIRIGPHDHSSYKQILEAKVFWDGHTLVPNSKENLPQTTTATNTECRAGQWGSKKRNEIKGYLYRKEEASFLFPSDMTIYLENPINWYAVRDFLRIIQ